MPESCSLFYVFEGKILKIKTSNANAPWVGGSSGLYINTREFSVPAGESAQRRAHVL
jgi:hypothetical protein